MNHFLHAVGHAHNFYKWVAKSRPFLYFAELNHFIEYFWLKTGQIYSVRFVQYVLSELISWTFIYAYFLWMDDGAGETFAWFGTISDLLVKSLEIRRFSPFKLYLTVLMLWGDWFLFHLMFLHYCYFLWKWGIGLSIFW